MEKEIIFGGVETLNLLIKFRQTIYKQPFSNIRTM